MIVPAYVAALGDGRAEWMFSRSDDKSGMPTERKLQEMWHALRSDDPDFKCLGRSQNAVTVSLPVNCPELLRASFARAIGEAIQGGAELVHTSV